MYCGESRWSTIRRSIAGPAFGGKQSGDTPENAPTAKAVRRLYRHSQWAERFLPDFSGKGGLIKRISINAVRKIPAVHSRSAGIKTGPRLPDWTLNGTLLVAIPFLDEFRQHSHSRIVISTRLFWALPSAVSFPATGLVPPHPVYMN